MNNLQEDSTTLAEAEEAMLELYVTRSGLKDGMSLLDLGCGWGSVALYMAQRFPASTGETLRWSTTG